MSQDYQARKGENPQGLRCEADHGQRYEFRTVDGQWVVLCPGKAHSNLGLAPGYPQQVVGAELRLHPALKLRPGSLALGGVRPGISAAKLQETLGPALPTGRPPGIRQYGGTAHVAFLERDEGAVGLVQGTALTGQHGRSYLVVGDTEEEARRLLGTSRKVGKARAFPPQGLEFQADGLRVHVDVEGGRVVRLALALPGYKPDWALWRR